LNHNLLLRVTSAVVALPLLAAIIAAGGWWIYGFMIVAGVVCFTEYGSIVASDDAFARRLLVLTGTAAIASGCMAKSATQSLLIVQGAAVLFAIIYTLRPGDMHTAWTRLTALFFGVVYISLPHVTIYHLRAIGDALPESNASTAWVWLALSATWGNDTAAYFAGRAFGKHKLHPTVSPKKTWEGFVGGAVGSVGIPLLLLVAFRSHLEAFSYVDVLFVGVPAAALGPLGDLTESLLKRSFDTKDSGGILPGHGGFLDRVDGVYFVAPWTLFYIETIRPLVLG